MRDEILRAADWIVEKSQDDIRALQDKLVKAQAELDGINLELKSASLVAQRRASLSVTNDGPCPYCLLKEGIIATVRDDTNLSGEVFMCNRCERKI